MPRTTTPAELVTALLRLAGPAPIGILFDYDGTLVDFTARPDLAHVDPETNDRLMRLAQSRRARVGIITGRSLSGLKAVAGPLDGVALAVNGGLRIVTPEQDWTQPDALHLKPALAKIAAALADPVARWPGALIESKDFGLTVHFRQAPEAGAALEAAAGEIVARIGAGFRMLAGKMSFEVQPAVDWNKGDAATALLDGWGVEEAALFVGDDRIDEPAFSEVRIRGGLACRVGPSHEDSAAQWSLDTPSDARELLGRLVEALAKGGPATWRN